MPPKLPPKSRVGKPGAQKISPAELIKRQQEEKRIALENAKKEALTLKARVENEKAKQQPQQQEVVEAQKAPEIEQSIKKSRMKFGLGNVNWRDIVKNDNKINTENQGTNGKIESVDTAEVSSVNSTINLENLNLNQVSSQTKMNPSKNKLPHVSQGSKTSESQNAASERCKSKAKTMEPVFTNPQIQSKDLEKPRISYRCPILCILGHVDTGKTKILDFLRKTSVQSSEAGGITQQIGATYFPMSFLKDNYNIGSLFPGLMVIDTPGHESFNNLRVRGSNMCNLCILVVDIHHGLENQTLESLELILKRKIPFVVALNKIDRLVGFNSQAKTSPCIQNNENTENMLGISKKSAKNKAATANSKTKSLNKKTNAALKTNAPKNLRDVKLFFDISKQDPATQNHFYERLQEIQLKFNEQGLNTVLFYANPDHKEYISIVPTSAITGDGLPDLLNEINYICAKMSKRLQKNDFVVLSDKEVDIDMCKSKKTQADEAFILLKSNVVSQEYDSNAENMQNEKKCTTLADVLDIDTIDSHHQENTLSPSASSSEKMCKAIPKEDVQCDLSEGSQLEVCDKVQDNKPASKKNTILYGNEGVFAGFYADSAILNHQTDLMSSFDPSFECTILETKVIEGLGTTIDVILSKGELYENDRICFSTYEKPVITSIRSILVTEPCKESRVKSALKPIKAAVGSCGVKISANDLEGALPGSRILKIDPRLKYKLDNLWSCGLPCDSYRQNILNAHYSQFKASAISEKDLRSLHVEKSDRAFLNAKEKMHEQERIYSSNSIKGTTSVSFANNISQDEAFNPIIEANPPQDIRNFLNKVFSTDRDRISFNNLIKRLMEFKMRLQIFYKHENVDLFHITGISAENIVESDEEALRIIEKDKGEIVKLANLSEKGCHVQASTLGSLEALLTYLNIPIASIDIGPLKNKDIKVAASNAQKLILAFDLPVSKEITLIAKDLGVKIISANIIYHLLDEYNKHMDLENNKHKLAANITFPCILSIVKNSIFTKRSPLVLGVEVRGILCVNTEIISITCSDEKNEPEKHVLGKVVSIEDNGKSVEKALSGAKVAIKIETKETPRVYKKHFNEGSTLVSNIRRADIDSLKSLYKDDMKQDDWRVVIELKTLLHII